MRIQVLPADAVRVEVSAFRPGGILPAAQAVLRREAGKLVSRVDLAPLTAGSITVNAAAKDELGKVLANATSTVDLRPNEVLGVRLTLVPVDKPIITGLSRSNGVPGASVAIFGAAFGMTSEYPIEILLGTGSTPVARAIRLSDGMLTFTVPDGAPAGPVVVRVGGLSATSSQVFSPIASLSLSPAATTSFAPNGLIDLAVTGRDSAGRPIEALFAPFGIAGKTDCPGGCNGGDSLLVDGAAGVLNVGAEPGTITVEAGSGSVAARAVIAVHALGRADLWPGMGPLPALTVPADNQLTPARVALGRVLFSEPRLSRAGTMSCRTCHDPAKGFGDGRRFALGSDGLELPRHTMSLLDAAFGTAFFWDGRAGSLEEQILAEMGNPRGLNTDVAGLEAYLAASASYVAAFQAAYESAPSLELVRKAIASYERTLVSPAGTAAFDRWAGGDDAALSAAAFRGLGVFLGKGRCVVCHHGPAFTDHKFHNIAIQGSGTLDTGRYGVTGNAAERGAFKTPGLRNVELTGPYFHDGYGENLDQATRHFEIFYRDFPNTDPLLRSVLLLGTDRADLLAFQCSLTATASY